MADTLKIPAIRFYFEQTLVSSFTFENVLERFIIASRTGSTELRKRSLALMMKENKNTLKTNNWRHLVKDNVDVVFELIMEGFKPTLPQKANVRISLLFKILYYLVHIT